MTGARVKARSNVVLLSTLCLLAACGDKGATSASSASGAPSAPAPAASALAMVPPPTTEWERVVFVPMHIAFRRPPSLITDEPEMTQEAAARWGPEIWSMSTKDKDGVGVHLSEVGAKAKQDRATWLKELKEGAVPGEVLLSTDDALIKRTRVLGKKSADGGPLLSDTHLDVGVCKKLEEVDYCLHVSGTADMALGRPGLAPKEALELVSMVRSLERSNEVPPSAAASASASAGAVPAPGRSGTLPAK
jgi:hypothetical protein